MTDLTKQWKMNPFIDDVIVEHEAANLADTFPADWAKEDEPEKDEDLDRLEVHIVGSMIGSEGRILTTRPLPRVTVIRWYKWWREKGEGTFDIQTPEELFVLYHDDITSMRIIK